MTHADVLCRSRLRLVGVAGELGNGRPACRILSVHPSTSDHERKSLNR